MHKLTLLGDPVMHSLSPKIQRQFAEQANIKINYTLTQCDQNQFADVVAQLRQTHLGCNVTTPCKQVAFQAADEFTDSALQAQSANTLKFVDQKIIAHNTDGLGLIADLTAQNIDLQNKTILILGAGGAARGIIAPLLQQQVKKIIISNRTPQHAEQLAKSFFSIGEVFAEQNPNETFDIIINTTPANLTAEQLKLNAAWLTAETFCYDINYFGEQTFLKWAQQHKVKYTGGLGMLWQQAALSFEFWFGVKPGQQN